MNDEYPPAYIKEYPEVFDRFTFDYLFKRLLADGYDNNEYYLEMSVSDGMVPDLLKMYREEFNKAVFNENWEIFFSVSYV